MIFVVIGKNCRKYRMRRSQNSRSALENEVMKVTLYNHVLYRFHCFCEKIRVGCVGVMDIDLLVWCSYQAFEFVCEENFCSLDVVRFAAIIWKPFADGAHVAFDLLDEEVDFVEEQYQG
jgi:hypothetical protein